MYDVAEDGKGGIRPEFNHPALIDSKGEKITSEAGVAIFRERLAA